MTDVHIRPITDVDELNKVADLQREVWGMPDVEVVPVHQLLAATAAGGVVLGAFDASGRLIGFCYGFVGLREGEVLFYSHMAGVAPAHRDRGVGFLLKRAQREAALQRGVRRMVWTYDPMKSLNARFNLHKLGAVAARYYVDYYGAMQDELNRGLPSDRLEVDWWLQDPRVEALMRGERPEHLWTHPATALAAAARGRDLTPDDPALNLDAPAVKVEIPTEFAALKRRDAGLGLDWLLAVRRTLQHYFGRGYLAVDYVVAGDRGAYVLRREGEP